MGFHEGHLYFGYVPLMDKQKFFVVVRSCREHAYIAPVNSHRPKLLAERLPECFTAIGPEDVLKVPPDAPRLQYRSWLSVAPKRARTLPSLLHRQRPAFALCGVVRPAVFGNLQDAISGCRVLKRKHRDLLLGKTGC